MNQIRTPGYPNPHSALHFGARLFQTVPLTYVEKGQRTTVPGYLFQLESDDIDFARHMFKQWPFPDETLWDLIISKWRRYADQELKVSVLMVGNPDTRNGVFRGRTLGFVCSKSESLFTTLLFALRVVDWNRRSRESTRQQVEIPGQFLHVAENLLAAAVLQFPDSLRLKAASVDDTVARYYRQLLSRLGLEDISMEPMKLFTFRVDGVRLLQQKAREMLSVGGIPGGSLPNRVMKALSDIPEDPPLSISESAQIDS
ncbi:MAG TPA: hypothetical protein V6C52_13270 [Coleofasciculaceae cyanobacterium]|jgi:hypothetical protein